MDDIFYIFIGWLFTCSFVSSLFISYYPIVPAWNFFTMLIPNSPLHNGFSWPPPCPYKVAGCSQVYDVPQHSLASNRRLPLNQDAAWLEHSKTLEVTKWMGFFVIFFSNAGLLQSMSLSRLRPPPLGELELEPWALPTFCHIAFLYLYAFQLSDRLCDSWCFSSISFLLILFFFFASLR